MGKHTIESAAKTFPGYDFDTFDGCVTAFQDEASVDDPEAFCSWLDEEGAEALSDPNAEEVLAGLEVEFVSAVDRPAQSSEWLIAKNQDDPDGDRHRWQSEVDLYVRKDNGGDVAGSDAKQIAFAPVLVPKEADKDGDIIPRPAIEDAAHKYIADYRKVDSDHDLRDGKGTPVESWTLKQDTSFELPDGTESREYPKGTWVMGIKFEDETWKRVEDGELSGLSIYGGAQPIDAEELMKGKGTTTGETVAEKQDEDPCEPGWTMVGTKIDENGNEVPNCVPEEDAEDFDPDKSESPNESMGTEKGDPDDPGNDGGSIEKEVDAGAITGMLGTVGESDDLSPDTSVKDFVMSLVQSDAVDEGQIKNMSVLLADGMGDDMEDDDEDDDEDDEDEMASDDGMTEDGIDLNVDEGKSEDAAGDVDKDDDVEKSAGSARVDQIASAVETLADTVEDLHKKVNEEPFADKMSDEDGLSDRIVKEITGHDDPEVARKAVAEQVVKDDGGADADVSYEGITDGEDVTAEASSAEDGGSDSLPNSKAANTRMTGEN